MEVTPDRIIDVFISHKSADKAMSKALYDYLKGKGLSVFESSESLPHLGSSDYRKEIDKALDDCKHMIVVGSSVENISSSWVEAEWGFYIGEKRAGRKKGNILTVITDNLEIADLPASLRYYEVVFFQQENFERLAAYVGKEYQDPQYKPPKKPLWKTKWFLPLLAALCLAGVFAFIINEKNQPFDVTFFLQKDDLGSTNNQYPPFEKGILSLFLDSKEEQRAVLPNQEVVIKQVPASFKGKLVPIRLKAGYWKLAKDSIVLKKTLTIYIVPDGSLATVFGNIKNIFGSPLSGCNITVDTDTTISSDHVGLFKVVLPQKMQKTKYFLSVNKEGYLPQKLDYFAGSGNIDIILKQ